MKTKFLIKMLTKEQIKKFREEVNTSKNPLFFFDDDPDGLCSFLLLYRMNREGHGTVIKSVPQIDLKFIGKVQEYHPDKIFVLDVPRVEQEFIDKAKKPIFWLDHHQPLDRNKVNYFNPRVKDPGVYLPNSFMAYQVCQQDLWIAMVGCLSDYYLPDFAQEFAKKYPKLIDQVDDKDYIIYNTPLGKLIRVFAFVLKGKTSEVNKCIKILTRVKSPEEILDQTTNQGAYIYKKFERINDKYEALITKAKKQTQKAKDSLFIFQYSENEMSFTAELSNELTHLKPDQLVIVARERNGEYKCSFRSKTKKVLAILEKALMGIDGYGGGHEYACGGCIQKHDWEQFLDNLRREIKAS